VLTESELYEPPRENERRSRRQRVRAGGRRVEETILADEFERFSDSEEEADAEIATSEKVVIPLWSQIDQQCRTCRDFRPADAGERGWCTNKWAFSHRRMVDADECPCATSIGVWWVPRDDFWLSKADVSRHSQPTPLLDRFLAQRRDSSGESDLEPQLRRRQR